MRHVAHWVGLLAALAALGCGSVVMDDEPADDAGLDTRSEIGGDIEPDVLPDTPPDGSPDGEPDGEPDVGPDGEPDGELDVPPNETADETPYEVPDETPDVRPDEAADDFVEAIDDAPDVLPDEATDDFVESIDEAPDILPDDVAEIYDDSVESYDDAPDVPPDDVAEIYDDSVESYDESSTDETDVTPDVWIDYADDGSIEMVDASGAFDMRMTDVEIWTLVFMGSGSSALFTLELRNESGDPVRGFRVVGGLVADAAGLALFSFGAVPLVVLDSFLTPFDGEVPAGTLVTVQGTGSVDFSLPSGLCGSAVTLMLEVIWDGVGSQIVTAESVPLDCIS